MKLNLKAIALTCAIMWGGLVFLAGISNLLLPSYANALLQIAASIYPGFDVSGTVGDVVVGTLYALLDGAIGGLVFGFLYNIFSAKFSK